MSSEGNAVAVPDLEALKDQINKVGDDIKTLKSGESPPDKSELDALVKQLLDLKRTYAQHNKGIGVDGKPFEEPLSKSEKKKREKAAKAAAAAAAGADATSGEGVNEVSTKNAAKKAAKKAEKAALKAAHKAGGGGADGTKPAAAKGGADVTAKAPTSAEKKTAAVSTTKNAASGGGDVVLLQQQSPSLRPMELSFSPNVDMSERPLVTLAVAVLCNIAPDLTLKSDHKRINPALGTTNGDDIVGDFAMARYLLLSSNVEPTVAVSLLGGTDFVMQAHVSAWMDYANAMKYKSSEKSQALLTTLEHSLMSKTYLVGYGMTLADLTMFVTCMTIDDLSLYPSVKRWLSMMKCHFALREAMALASNIAGNNETSDYYSNSDEKLDDLVEGMNYLEGGMAGTVTTRFPPEPSGYLHIGHAKACLLNDYFATRYKGRLLIRFDDTNPSKEKEEFQQSILQDLERLGVHSSVVSFTSDYFETILGYAHYLIQHGLAYMDDTPQEEMQALRMELKPSKYRSTQSPEECMELFQLMCSGSPEGSKWCLRAKMDYKSVNGTLRDPVIYRQNLTPHHNSGTTYKAYPTYDLACPIVDSIEGVSHALRTTEYNDRDEQYAWFQHFMKLRRTRIHAIARMNFMYTELSKRKLGWFVTEGLVEGWDDPRFPTIQGIKRRGVNIDALRQFILSQGASRRVVNMDWSKFWAENKKHIDLKAKRFMAIDSTDHVVLTITNAPSYGENAFVLTDYHPKDPSMGKRCIRISSRVLLETNDTEGMVEGEHIVLMRWGVVKLTHVDLSSGKLQGEYIPNGDIKSCKRKITWLATSDSESDEPYKVTVYEFDNLISKEKINDDEDFKQFINPHTKAISTLYGDLGIKQLQQNEIVQLERRGYYRVDRPHIRKHDSITLFMIPDGKTKSMSGLTGKLAHR